MQLYVLVDKLITMVITTALVNIMDYADNSIYRELILRICEDVELAIIMLIRLNIGFSSHVCSSAGAEAGQWYDSAAG